LASLIAPSSRAAARHNGRNRQTVQLRTPMHGSRLTILPAVLAGLCLHSPIKSTSAPSDASQSISPYSKPLFWRDCRPQRRHGTAHFFPHDVHVTIMVLSLVFADLFRLSAMA
jgi:hypothetical protein